MKALFIARKFPPSVGGMEKFAFELSEALENKIELRKITWGGGNKWLPVVLPWFFIRGLVILVTNRDIDIIHVQDALQAPLGWLLGKITHRPYIIVTHGLDITYKNYIYQKTVLPFVRKSNKIIAISTATKKQAIKKYISSDKLQIITIGIHDSPSSASRKNKRELENLINLPDIEKSKILLTTGRLVRRKGVAWFIANVMPKLVKKTSNILYVVVGTGAEHDNIKQSIEHHNLQKYIVLLGRITEENKELLYKNADMFVMPNIRVSGDMEGFGIVAIEASSAGLPVVASKLEGISDAIKTNKNGILVKPMDTTAYLESIESFLDTDTAEEFGKMARSYTFDNYSWTRIADQYIEMYEEVCSKII